jgi:hypothetical protein
VAADADELLHAELDRQLAEVRTACDGLATRSGLLVAAIAAVAAVLAPRINPAHHEILLVCTSIVLGIATLAGVATISPWLRVGPAGEVLQDWLRTTTSIDTPSALYLSKNVILGANQRRMSVMRTIFLIQAIATIAAAGLALWYTASR